MAHLKHWMKIFYKHLIVACNIQRYRSVLIQQCFPHSVFQFLDSSECSLFLTSKQPLNHKWFQIELYRRKLLQINKDLLQLIFFFKLKQKSNFPCMFCFVGKNVTFLIQQTIQLHFANLLNNKSYTFLNNVLYFF